MHLRPLPCRRSAIALAVTLAYATAPAGVHALSCAWNPASGNWSAAANWSCGAVPGINDDATIAAAKAVTVDSAQSVRSLVNAGSVNLDAFMLTLSGAGTTTNTGTITVGGAATAALQVGANHHITNTGGLVTVGSGSVVNQFGSTITGGTIVTTGSGRLAAANTSANFLSGVRLDGVLDMAAANGIERVTGGLTLNGRVDIGQNSIFAPQGDQTISGNGQIVFADTSGSNRFNLEAGNLTLGPNIVVRGSNGTIGIQSFAGGGATLTNNGTIQADVAGTTITMQVNGLTTNNGTLAALNGGTLVLNRDVAGGAGSQIVAGAGSTVLQNGITISGPTTIVGTGSFRPTTNGSNMLAGVTLTGVLDLASAQGIERVSGGLTLASGSVSIGANSILAPQGDQTIGGTGSIVFADASGSNRLNVEAGNLTLGPSIVVRGGNGTIGNQSFAGGAATLTNNGTIQADVAGTAIALQVSGLTTNNGTLAALNGGTLFLNSPVTGTSGSTIVADALSTVVQNGVTLSGDMNLTGAGTVRPSNSGSNFLSGVTLSGTLDMASALSSERVSGGLTLAGGSVRIGADSVLAPQGTQTIGGSGEIVFIDGSSTNNRLNVEAGVLTLGPGVTVRGGPGVIGNQSFAGGAATLINQGLISADTSGRTISVSVTNGVVNQSTMRAVNGGQLALNGMTVDNTAGLLLAGDASTVSISNATIAGGELRSEGSGRFVPSNSSTNFINGARITGVVDMASALGALRLSDGGMVLDGTMNIGSGSVFAPQGTQMISGSGRIVFADTSGSNRLNVEAGDLTLGPSIVVRGGNGTIGNQSFAGGGATLTNNGTIQADVAGTAIALQVSGLTTNNGTLAALNGGTLFLNSPVTGTGGSTIVADALSTVVQNGVALSGDMNLTGAGTVRPSNSGSNFLSGVTLSGTLDMASALSSERVSGGLTLAGGSVRIGADSVLAPQGTQTIGGSGEIVFIDGSSTNNRLNVEAGVLTLGPGVTVRGGPGVIGNQSFAGGAATLINQGLISADTSGRTISVSVNNGVVNQATMRAVNGGNLLLSGMTVDNTAGLLLAGDASTVSISNATIAGGELRSDGSGRFVPSNSSTNFINGARITGVVDLASANGTLRLSDGGMVLDGTMNIGSGSVFAPQGTQTISGSGRIVFADSGGANRLNVEAGALTLGAGVTVRGITGTIGNQNFVGGAASLTNLGTIVADGGGTITIANNGALTNDGLFRAQSGVLAVQRNVTGSGTLQVDATGAMTLANGGNTQGTLAMGSAGAALNLGSGNLTINADYTNAAAGTGNAFDRRAGVSGAGQIVSGGNAAQAITGARVSGGTTTNATLTIPNVRVGASTFEYRVGNTGTTGPALRGAIQTSVNGANLTDARLSGSGVTPSNYLAALGGDSGALAVTFTPAAAGVLAPLTGQVINLRSNFENIADQKLNIVLSPGAAAYNPAQGSAAPSPLVVPNQRVGGAASAALTVSNTAPAGAFSEDLNASFAAASGQALHDGGSVSGLLAGTASAGAMNVRVDTASAGARSGTVTLAYQTAGAVAGVSNGLGTASAGSQVIDVSGNVYELASGQILTPTLNFGVVQVGQVVSQPLVIRNTATGAAGFVEDLNAAFGASTDPRISGSGTFAGIAAGTDSHAGLGAMRVSVDTSAVGTVNGSIRVDFTSAGAVGGVSNGLGLAGVGGADYGVNGSIIASVIDTARPVTNGVPSPAAVDVAVGNLRIGTTPAPTLLSVLNQATGMTQAHLNASIASNGAPVLASGSFTGLLPAQTNNSALGVAIDTASAGPKSGSASISFVSDASSAGCTSSCELALPSQTVNVSGAVYRLANPTLGTPTLTIAARVGDAVAANRAVVVANSSPDVFTEGLSVAVSGATGNAQHNGGTITNLPALASNGTAILVGLASTASAGLTSGSVDLAFTSTGAGTTGAPDVPAATAAGTVTVNGRVYTPAIGQLNTAVVDFGIVRVGDAVAPRAVNVANAASTSALGDTLRADITGTAAPFGGGSVAGVAAQANANIALSLDTSTAGAFDQTGAVVFTSQNPDLSEISAGSSAALQLRAQINHLANADFDLLAGLGTLTQSGADYVLDLGNVTLGSRGALTLQLDNDVAGPADLLRGDFDLAAIDDFMLTGWTAVSGLGAGEAQGGLRIEFDASALGAFEDALAFDGFSFNASDPAGIAQQRRLLIRANVVDGGPGTVPEPGSLALLLLAATGAWLARRRGAGTRTARR